MANGESMVKAYSADINVVYAQADPPSTTTAYAFVPCRPLSLTLLLFTSPAPAPVRRGTVALQAIVRGRAARSAVAERRRASTRLAAWWRAAAEAGRYRRARRQVVIVQSLLRGRLGRKEVAARWLELGRRFSKHQAATMIQVRCLGLFQEEEARGEGEGGVVEGWRGSSPCGLSRSEPSLSLL